MKLKTAERKVSQTGFRYVVEARVLNMIKWTRIIIFVAIANPILYLLSIGIGVGSLIDSKYKIGLAIATNIIIRVHLIIFKTRASTTYLNPVSETFLTAVCDLIIRLRIFQ